MKNIDKDTISDRFFEFFAKKSHAAIAKEFDVARQSVDQWNQKKSPVPWGTLKVFVDAYGISWDWLLEGQGEQCRQHVSIADCTHQKFDIAGINERFLSLFDGMLQREIALEIGVSREAVESWRNNRRKVPWERMGYAVRNKNVTWEWLIEGRDPKFR